MPWFKKKTWKIILFVFLVIILIAGSIHWFITYRLEKNIKSQLEAKVTELTNGFYRLKIHSLNVHLFNGNLIIKDISLHPDSTIFQMLKSSGKLPSHYIDADIKSLEATGARFIKKQIKGRLDFSLLKIQSPDIKFTETEEKNSEEKNKETKTLYKIISPILDTILVKNIRINDGKFKYHIKKQTDTITYALEKINFDVNNFLVDSLSEISRRILYCENIHLQTENIHHILPGKAYQINIGKIGLKTIDSTLNIENIRLTPQYSKYEFAHKIVNHPDWMELTIAKINCKGIGAGDLFFDKKIMMDSLRIENIIFNNFKNQKIVITHHKMPLIYENLQKAVIPVYIKNIQVKNANITYEELSKTGNKPGIINFSEVDGTFQDFTNIVSYDKQYINLKARGKLMGEGLINATFRLPVSPDNDHFHVQGTLGPMNLQKLNSIIIPMIDAEIKSGHLDGMDFTIDATSKGANLNMLFLYNNLSVKVLKDGNKWALINKAANLLIKHDNPDKGKEVRRVNTYHTRDPYHSTFNYLWKIMLPGIIETVGYTKDKQEKVSWVKKEINIFKKKIKKTNR